MKILVTGGCGYIGSHTVLSLITSGFKVVVLDNLSNGSYTALRKVETLGGKKVTFVQGDVRDSSCVMHILKNFSIDAVIHFAGMKSVGESFINPLEYYEVNVGGTLALLAAMKDANVNRLVFSSSATVYGTDAPIPYKETYVRGLQSNPYGKSKAMVEAILEDQIVAKPSWAITMLRYFNPIGAHESGEIGESSSSASQNLMPIISQVALGKLDKLSVFGDDYPTADGTCERDYIHVMDLAEGHIKALSFQKQGVCEVFNLGTGMAISVLELVKAFESHTGIVIPYEIVERRIGDLAKFWADTEKAERKLGWKALRSLDDMIVDTWRWLMKNPHSFKS